MSVKVKDFAERLGFTLLFCSIGFTITYLTGNNNAYALAIIAILQIAKNLLAQQYGDHDSSGFTNLDSSSTK